MWNKVTENHKVLTKKVQTCVRRDKNSRNKSMKNHKILKKKTEKTSKNSEKNFSN